jgi:hypothetical protein
MMIKKSILAVMAVILAVSFSLAAGPQGIHEPGTGLTNPEIKEAIQGTGQGLQAANDTNISKVTPGIHEPGTGIANPEIKKAAQGTGQGSGAQAGQPAKEPAAPTEKAQPGFEAIFSLTGLIAIASVELIRRNRAK